MRWYKSAAQSMAFGSNLALGLSTLTAIPYCLWLASRQVHGTTAYLVGILPLALAAILMTVLSGICPGLVGDRVLQLPLTMTLPALYTALVLLSATLAAGLVPAIMMFGDEPRTDQVWSDLRVIALAWGWQVLALSLGARLLHKRTGVKPC